jgi:hypothetical protein
MVSHWNTIWLLYPKVSGYGQEGQEIAKEWEFVKRRVP